VHGLGFDSSRIPSRTEFGFVHLRVGTLTCMDTTAAIILILLVVVLPAVLVGGLFVWAVKDGQEDRALQAQLWIRRRTRFGR
jgi:hypothetical protein